MAGLRHLLGLSHVGTSWMQGKVPLGSFTCRQLLDANYGTSWVRFHVDLLTL